MNRKRRIEAAAAILGLITAAALTTTLLASHGPHGPFPANAASPGAEEAQQKEAGSAVVSDGSAPLLFGVEDTLSDAQKKAGFHLYRPQHELANDSLIEHVWVEETSNDDDPWVHVSITYSSGIRMYLLPAWVDGFDKDPESIYAGMAGSFGSRADTDPVEGHPALVLEKGAAGPAAIDLIIDGVRIQIIGGDAPVDAAAVTAIADTLE